jgi:biopolymer transport protein ExbB
MEQAVNMSAKHEASLVLDFFKRFQDGDTLDVIVMGSILAMLFFAIAIIIERVYMILFVYESNGAALMQRIQRLVLDNKIDDAVKLCNTRKSAVLYQVFKSALVNAHRPFDEVQDHVEVAKLAVIPKLQQRMPYLFTMGNVATLMGLLGTVIGLVRTFAGVGALEASQKQALLSSGIATALNATAFGLMVAVPCMFAYGFLFNRINGIIDEIEHYSARLLMLLRTGSEYYENFNSTSGDVTTQQTPKKSGEKRERDVA